MARHVLSMTYAPKIDAVQDGRCTQTIRRGDVIKVGDSIMFHGWSGKPYRSEWNNQMRVTVSEVVPIFISEGGIGIPGISTFSWGGARAHRIAISDFIDPPTGLALRDVLFKLNGAPSTPERYQIIRWKIDWDATNELRKEASE